MEKKGIIALGWPNLIGIAGFLMASSTAYADAVGFAKGIGDIPAAAWFFAALTALAGGFTDIMIRLSNVPPTIDLKWPPVARSIYLSLMAGGIGFMGGLQFGIPSEAMMLTIFGSALAGTKIIEALRQRITKQADKLA